MTEQPPPACPTADVVVAAPPEPSPSAPSGVLVRLLPAVMSVAMVGAMAVAFLSGSAVARNPMFLTFPMMMLVSVGVTALTGRGGRRGINADRAEYLGYLSLLRRTVAETAVAQRLSLTWAHLDPDALWTLIGGPRMWDRRAADPDFCVVRVGVGTRPLATRLVAPETRPMGRSDPVTATALDRFLHTHSTIADAPITIGLRGIGTVTIDGDPVRVRGLIRAMVCQLAVRHSPDQLRIAGAISDRNLVHWEWLKWLPHNRHPSAANCGPAVPHVVVIADPDDPTESADSAPDGATIVEVGTGGQGAPLTIRHPDVAEGLVRSDQLDLIDALVCARRLAAHRAVAGSVAVGWSALVGIDDVRSFDPMVLWRRQNHIDRRDRLRAPIGTTVDGAPLELDIKEAAENGMGPHGLCVGATGSGKSELLRTVALGMMARNSPEVLNLLLIDFKGGATFLDLARAPHVAAVITNLAEEAPLVARMRDALAGEMNRRQQLLRAAGSGGVRAYEQARRAGAKLGALPTLFIIVDEFSELLGQHPDFADMFVAIGRLGRSLGMHLLLSSQRLEEGRLRGLEAHLSYRVCLKTLSASESRAVLGTLDAYELPNTPGAGLLRSGAGELIRFQAAFVSGPVRDPKRMRSALAQPVPTVQLFTSPTTGPVTPTFSAGDASTPSVLQAVLDRVAGHGPPAHQVWLPPLQESPSVRTLLRHAGSAPPALAVPIGLVDRPLEQSRTLLMVELSGAAGNVAVVGAPRSGKSTALRTLITALAVTHDPAQVQFYCLDFGGGGLTALRALPHVGAVAGRAEPRLVGRMIAELESIVRSREELFGRRLDAATDIDPFGEVFLVVDGWASLRNEFEGLEEAITALAVQGLSFGVHVVLSASRWAEIRPSLKDQLGTRVELRLGDPADSELDRKQARQVPRDRPGRGLSSDGLHMVIALPIESDELPRRHGESGAPRIPLLPARVDHDAMVHRVHRAGDKCGQGILLGLEERGLRPVAVDFEHHLHLLIFGDNECGKTATLRTLCREIARTKTAGQAQLLIVDFRRTLLGVVESEHLGGLGGLGGGYAMSPAALEALLPGVLDELRRRMPPPQVSQAQLRARSWWSGPDIYVVADDYDLIATPAGNPMATVLEYLPYARDLGLHLLVARRSAGAARALFDPLLTGLRDLGCMGLIMSGRPDEGTLLGSVRPLPLPPGRGVLVTRTGDEQLVQVAWSPP